MPVDPKTGLTGWAIARAKGRLWTPADTRSQLELAEPLLMNGKTPREIMRAIQQAGHPVGLSRTNTLLSRIRETWSRESNAQRESNRAAAEKRTMALLAVAREEAMGEKDLAGGWKKDPNWEAHRVAQRWEAHLADLQGTREPIKVNIDLRVSEACTNVIASLSPERTAELLANYRENLMLAARYRAMQALPAAQQNGKTG